MTAANDDTRAFQKAANDLENILAQALARLDQRGYPRVRPEPRSHPDPTTQEESVCSATS